MARGRSMRNPNGYGSVVKLSGNRKKPFEVRVNTRMDDRYYPVYDVLDRFATRGEANIALAKYNDDPYDVNRAKMTFDQVYREYFDDKYVFAAKKLSRSSADCTRLAYRHCAPLYEKPYAEIRKNDFQRILFTPDKNGKQLSHAVQEHILNLIKQMDKYALANDIIKKGYAAFVQITVNDDDHHGVPFADDDLRRLWAHKDIPFVDTILIYCYSGWRINELARMPLENIDLAEGTFVGGLKTKYSKNRIVPIHSAIKDLVEARYDPRFKSLIYHDTNRDILEQDYRRYFAAALTACGIKEPHTPHDCRHTFNDLLRRAGADISCRYKLMGHMGKDVNERIYTHLTAADLRPEIEKIKAPVE